MSTPVYRIGSTSGGMASLDSLGLPLPKASPVRYSQRITLGNGSQKDMGWQICEWRFAFISLAQLAILRGYCSGSSATVYIQTLEENGTYGNYSAEMVWPDKKPPKVDFIADFVLTFRKMIAL